jgi:hypothetical protein
VSKFKKLLLGISIFIGLGILSQSLYPAGFTNIGEFIAGDGIKLQKYRNQLVISRDAPAYGPDDTINVLGINTSDLITKGPWVDVRAFMDGLSGRPTYATWYADQANTDVILVLDAANAAAKGVVYFPSGIYAISSTFVLKTNTAYLGSPSGTYPTAQEHPVSGYGAALRWIGSASGVMVSAYNVYNVMWDGIDLDGVNYTNDVTGIKHYSNNSPTSQHCTFRNFNALNLGCGMIIGDNNGVTHYQTDGWVVERFVFYKVNIGIRINSQNGSQYSSIRNGMIGCYHRGIYLHEAAGTLKISSMSFLGLGNAAATSAWIYFYSYLGQYSISEISGEALPGMTGWLDILIDGTSTYSPITIQSSYLVGGIKVNGGGIIAKIISIGNHYNTGQYEDTGIVLNDNNTFISIGDTFMTVDDHVHEIGVNNYVAYINPSYWAGIVNATQFQYTFNGVSNFRIKNTISTYADNAAALAASLVAGDVYKTATGQLMIVY